MVVFGHDTFFYHVSARARAVKPPVAKPDIGTRGVRGDSQEHFNHPQALAVSYTVQRMGWLYVADMHNNRVQVFDAKQVYRATVAPVGLEKSEWAHSPSPAETSPSRSNPSTSRPSSRSGR